MLVSKLVHAEAAHDEQRRQLSMCVAGESLLFQSFRTPYLSRTGTSGFFAE